MRKSLTAAYADAAEPPKDAAQVDVWDTRLKGFGLRVSRWGRKSWVAMYRHGGRKRRVTIGEYPRLSLADARDMARNILADAAKGGDPATAKLEERKADTFEMLAALYIQRYANQHKKPRSVHEDKRIIDRELLPAWRQRKAHDIRRVDVIALLDKIMDRDAPVMANRVKALVSKIFNFALERDIVEVNPAASIASPGAEQKRDRVLSADEVRQIWAAVDKSGGRKAAALFKLLLLTAQRKSEVLGMTWDEVDSDSGWWTIAAERSKNHLAHRVPLTPSAMTILRELQSVNSTGLVFPGGKRGQPLANVAKPLRQIVSDSGIQFRWHDLRRTAASHMTGIGVLRLVVSKLLNHVEQSVTAVYDRHSYDAEKRAALLKWDRHLSEIISGSRPSNVVALHA
jgi:integrase